MNEEHEVSRRDFLKLAGAIGSGLAAGVTAKALEPYLHLYNPDSVWGVELDGDGEFNFFEAAKLAIRLDQAYDRLPKIEPDQTQQGLYAYAVEIIPQFEYEGIVPRTAFPKSLDYVIFDNGDDANHVLGRSDCSNWAVLNGRMILPRSTFANDELLFTLAHELAHVAQGQGPDGCDTEDRALVENSAQLAALEVVSGLALQGNPEYFASAVAELRGMALTTAYGLALKEENFEQFHDLRSRLSPGAFSEARFQKSRRRWRNNQDELMEIIDRYNVTPLNLLHHAFNNFDEIEGLAFPRLYEPERGNYRYSVPIKFDDTRYLLEHLEELTLEVHDDH